MSSNWRDLTLDELNTFYENLNTLDSETLEGLYRWVTGQKVDVKFVVRTTERISVKFGYTR